MNETNKTMVTIKILDQTGHSTLEQTMDEAVGTTFKQHFTHGKWPFVNTENGVVPFEFTANSLDDTEALKADAFRMKNILADNPEPTVVMTGPLQGGTH